MPQRRNCAPTPGPLPGADRLLILDCRVEQRRGRGARGRRRRRVPVHPRRNPRAARALLGLGIGEFWAIAVGVGTRLLPERFGPRATSLIFGGISIGTVVGVPAGPLLGHQFGWRAAFFIVAALGLIPVILQAVFLPRLSVAKAVTLRSLGALLRNSRARVALAMTLLTITAQFSAYTFVAPFLQQRTGAGPTLISTLLLVFAAAGILGNFATAAALTKALRPTVLGVLAALALSQLLMPVLGRGRPGRSSSSRSGD
ncbi:MFS transporter [Streptomyces sp. NPDC058467]|uniref:MFS transporter n=1 Tax=Streptomyces sp. NPDC058467 TaxID=3346513 RepID=UPI00365C272F